MFRKVQKPLLTLLVKLEAYALWEGLGKTNRKLNIKCSRIHSATLVVICKYRALEQKPP